MTLVTIDQPGDINPGDVYEDCAELAEITSMHNGPYSLDPPLDASNRVAVR
jgi:hypothetical protein